MQLREWYAPFFSCSKKGWWLGRHEPNYEEGTIAGMGSFSVAPPIPLPTAVATSESLGWQQQSCHFLVSWSKRKHSHGQHWTCLINQKYFRHFHRECTSCIWLYGIVSIGHFSVLYLAPSLSLESQQKFWLSTSNLQIPSYNRNVREFLRESWRL